MQKKLEKQSKTQSEPARPTLSSFLAQPATPFSFSPAPAQTPAAQQPPRFPLAELRSAAQQVSPTPHRAQPVFPGTSPRLAQRHALLTPAPPPQPAQRLRVAPLPSLQSGPACRFHLSPPSPSRPRNDRDLRLKPPRLSFPAPTPRSPALSFKPPRDPP